MRHLAAVFLVLGACGSTEGTAKSTGDLNGSAFSAVDAVYASGISPPVYLSTYSGVDNLVGTATGLLVSSDPHACADIVDPQTPGSSGFFAMLFVCDGNNNATPPSGPGTYYVYDPGMPFGQGDTAVVSESPCGGDAATGGTITLTSTSPNLVGTFDVTFADGSEATGSFNAVSCSAATCD